MLNVAEQAFETLQGHLDQCVRFRTAAPMNGPELARALSLENDPSGRRASASLFFTIGYDGEITVVGIKIDATTFGLKPQMPHHIEVASTFAQRL